ncbi:MAG TPA: tRNA pseudouridine(55) synthase TruB [Caldisericia bacterium]|nr:tRNA pseudouridine(55) synthase TruB [Caldisericia bacterium]HPF48134.1 tRNA pseudouridine(55) synthase TruB [Caldisericia bacterium]HPI83929.1 tRNA pseudouridine(55) synthase TruB [Caldisericia bacterium]HPQ92587.1 tRNA pseudouridine(55) synthase TruB [Caldisericia bacterium]HRV74315.1 tRNA pseudouridine(55) synthase TruB [Caldisericia bacterium]
MTNLSGAIAINKPEGPTSFQTSDMVRKIFSAKKAGYVGTLDAHATGVLLVVLGKGTKLIPFLKQYTKTYRAKFRLGATSSTFDVWGDVKSHGYDGDIDRIGISQLLDSFKGEIDQIPPMFSAKSVNGKKLYKYALEGIEIPRKPNRVEIKNLELTKYNQEEGSGEFVMTCTKGTYVRSLIADLGEKAGCGAIMTGLVRLEDSNITVGDCHTIDELEAKKGGDSLFSLITPIEQMIGHIPEIDVTEFQTKKLSNGGTIKIQGNPAKAGYVRIMHDGNLFGVGKYALSVGELYPERIL